MGVPAICIDDLPELATAEEVAQVLRCSPRYIKNECANGRMRAARVANKYLIERQSVREYLAKCRNQTEAPISIGAMNENNGLSVGSKEADSARKQRALDAARKLKQRKPSGASSSPESGPARVIHLSARS